MFVWMISSGKESILSPNLVCLCSIMSRVSYRKKKKKKPGVLSLMSRLQWGQLLFSRPKQHSKGSNDENVVLSTMSSELLIPWQPSLVWWYIIISQGVLWKKKEKKNDCVQGQGHSEQTKCLCLSRWYLLNCLAFCYQTWYCDASSWAGVHAKRFVGCFKGQGHSKGSYDQTRAVSTISSELHILLLPNCNSTLS